MDLCRTRVWDLGITFPDVSDTNENNKCSKSFKISVQMHDTVSISVSWCVIDVVLFQYFLNVQNIYNIWSLSLSIYIYSKNTLWDSLLFLGISGWRTCQPLWTLHGIPSFSLEYLAGRWWQPPAARVAGDSEGLGWIWSYDLWCSHWQHAFGLTEWWMS